MSSAQTLTRKQVFGQSWPIMLANGAAPIVGLVDTFVIGRFVGTAALAGIGLGAVIYGVVYWGFGFLRMSTAGLAAQSDGQGAEADVQSHIIRALPIGLSIGLIILLVQAWLLPLAFQIYTASVDIESSATTYIQARLWGLPATLASIALMGWFVGISRAGLALGLQIVLNVVNIILSPVFVLVLGGGLYGVGLASSIAEWAGLAAGLFLAYREIKRRGGFRTEALSRKLLLAKDALSKLGVANGNIFIRTMAMTVGFNFFGNAAASEGETFLAGYHILMQFIAMSALILDGFAHTAEAVTGAAYGAKDRKRFDRAVKLTTEFSALFALLCSAAIYLGGPFIIAALTQDPAVQASAATYLPLCALAPILGFAAFQMDGIFIGTTRTVAMRNAGIVAVILYIGAHYLIYPIMGAAGIWIAFLFYYVARAITLGVAYPSITKHLDSRNKNELLTSKSESIETGNSSPQSAKDELIDILKDTKTWAAKTDNIDTFRIYSRWKNQEELLSEIDEHIANAHQETADFEKLYTLYAPTSGLCEIITHDLSSNSYMNLASRFDHWYSSIRRI